MADPQYTLEEFGQRIKAKYPQYANLSDTDIANKVLAKYPQYRASIKPPSTPSQPTAVLRAPTQRERFLNPNFYPVGQKGEGLGENLKNIAQRGGVGIFQLADAMTHPVDTLEGIAASVTPQELLDYGSTHGREGELRRKLASGGTLTPEEQQYLDKATRFENAQSPAQALTEAVTTSRGPMELAGKAAPLAGQAVAGELLGEVTGPVTRGLKDTVSKTREGVRQSAQSLTGAGSRAVKAEVTKAGESQAAADTAHQDAVQNALHETQGRELKYKQDTEAAKAKAEETNKANVKKAIADREKAIADRKAAEEKLTAEKLKQGKIKPAQAKLENAWSDLQAGVETAREKALEVGNEKYSGVNAALNPIEADFGNVSAGLEEATEKIKGSQIRGSEAKPRILEDIQDRIQKGDTFTYEDMQGYYSELNRELSKGTLPGDVYAAYDTLHEAIGNEMQRIANSKGQGAALLDARNYWRRMKQTFGKPLSLSDVATKATSEAAPDVARAAEMKNRIRLLGSFDSRLPGLFEHIENLQKGVESLPEPVSARQLVQSTKVPSLPPRKPTMTRVEPEPVKAPERVPIPDRPEQGAVNTRELHEKLVDKWASGESSLNKWQVRALLSGGLSALIDGLGLLGGHAPGIGSMALETAGTAAYTFGPATIAKLFENAKFREWITRPPAGELETLQKLPNADRIRIEDGLNRAVQQARSKGINVDPALAAIVGASIPQGPKAQQLQRLADEQRQNPPQ